ncbi:MAG: branched-chain amino acid ABC transporter permease, partial [Rhodobacter sp.]|nr:branched-chain amino acid ABC transporter permease [Rhodobacter sp.]
MLPTGIHFESYAAETRVLKTRRSQVWLAILVAALLVAPFFAGAYLTGIASEMFITLMAVYGLYITVGMAGQINIAQSAFVGVGAFAAAKLSGYGVPVFLVIPLAAFCTGCVSVLFALP